MLAAACAIALGGCNLDGQPGLSAAQPRGASVAFESIDGPPAGQFQKLVQDLNDEAQSRRLAVISRDSPSAYRVRGNLAAKESKDQSTISWVWDVFDGDERRAFRISGEETANSGILGPHRDAWTAADDAVLQRIAHNSMDQLAAFTPDDSSPEAAGIYRIVHHDADPVGGGTAEGPTAANENAGPVPMPRRRPGPADAAVSAQETRTLAASRS